MQPTRRLSRPFVSVLGALGLLAYALPSAADVLPAGRRTTWSPGIPGGIPNLTTVCTTVNASTYGNGTQDATNGIQNAINNCPNGQVVRLSAGDFLINNSWLELNKGVVLRGAGSGSTRLRKTNNSAIPVIVLGERFVDEAASVNLTANAAKGANSVQVSSTSGFSVGQLVLVDEVTDSSFVYWGMNCPNGDDCRGWFSRYNRPVAQMLEIATIAGNVVSFTTPLHIGFRTSQQAQLTRFSFQGVRNAGLEDLHVTGGKDDNVVVRFAMYSWVKNIESSMSMGDSIALDRCVRCVIRDSYFHDTPDPTPGGNGYMLSLAEATADSLVENNIFINGNKVMVMRATGGGNVIGYNYFDNGFISYALGWMETGMNAGHMAEPHFELFEGNQAFNIDGDDTWGGATYITYFRNHATGKRRSYNDIDNRRAIGLMYGHYNYSFVGNVLGTAGQSPAPYSGFTYEDLFPWSDNPVAMYRLGYAPENWNLQPDPGVVSSVFRHANYDYVTNGTPMVGGYDTVLPNSLYLSAKPPFFGNFTWPWVDSLGPVKLHTLPARARYDGVTIPPAVSVGDATKVEGTGANSTVSFPVTLTFANVVQATVAYATTNGTATSGQDYTAASGTLTLPPGTTSTSIQVTVVADGVDEVDETFNLTISAPSNVALGDAQGVVTIDDDDGPAVATTPAAVTEGSGGSSPLQFNLGLSASSPQTVVVSYETSNGTATAGQDFTTAAGTVTFPPGTTSVPVAVALIDDSLDEPNETFNLNLSTPVDATLGVESVVGRILDDDGGTITLHALGHGSRMVQDLQSAGGQSDADLYLVNQPQRSSWEVVVDAASGDLGDPGPLLVRVGTDLTSILQTSVATGTGTSRSLRWRNNTSTATDGYVRVTSQECNTNCGAEDSYRIRAYDTTLMLARYNQAGPNNTVLILHNPTNATIAGEVYYWSPSGALRATSNISIARRSTSLVNLANITALVQTSGSATLTHNGPYGGIVAKAVTLDSTSGFSFDAPFVPHAR
jgi:hypothetical protein